MENVEEYQETLDSAIAWIGEFAVSYGLQLIGAVIALIAGLWVVNKISGGIYRMMEKREIDPSLRSFLKSFISILLKILLIISILGMVGVEMTSFIAILGAAGLAIGLALSGTLQNFAGGVLILIIKPFRVGDVIEAQGFMGTVSDIQIFNTIITSFDNVVSIVPNGSLATNAVTNYSLKETRRAQWVFSIAYGDNFQKAQQVLKKLLTQDERILKEPETFIFLSELNDSSVDITVRAWIKTENFWPVFFSMSEKVYDAFAKEGLNIPFPQMDVHLHNTSKS